MSSRSGTSVQDRIGIPAMRDTKPCEARHGPVIWGESGQGEARFDEVNIVSTKIVECTIRGMSPHLMHSFPMTEIKALEKKTPLEQAEIAAYRDPDTKELYVPGIAIQRCFISGATYSKGKGRASLQKQVAACVLVNPERCSLGMKEFLIDSRPVVVPATKGRVIRHRPKLVEWNVSFRIEYDDTLLRESELRQVVDDSGSRVGLLDFRPEKKGPFGRFMITKWEA